MIQNFGSFLLWNGTTLCSLHFVCERVMKVLNSSCNRKTSCSVLVVDLVVILCHSLRKVKSCDGWVVIGVILLSWNG